LKSFCAFDRLLALVLCVILTILVAVLFIENRLVLMNYADLAGPGLIVCELDSAPAACVVGLQY
jgi:hypothetical protein